MVVKTSRMTIYQRRMQGEQGALEVRTGHHKSHAYSLSCCANDVCQLSNYGVYLTTPI